jgi:hypothetical protein
MKNGYGITPEKPEMPEVLPKCFSDSFQVCKDQF